MDAIALWPGTAPGSEDWTHTEAAFTEASGAPRVRNVVVPTLTPHLPDPARANGTAVIVAPGGGFRMLSLDHEGTDLCDWLCARGVACFLLKYRLGDTGATEGEFWAAFGAMFAELLAPDAPKGPAAERAAGAVFPLAVADAEQAVRVARASGVRVDRLGFIGFSAGAALATATALSADAAARPDFIGAIYGASTVTTVAADAPKMFSVVCADDPLCLDDCVAAFRAWHAAGRTPELHIYAEGGHGFGLKPQGKPVDAWPEQLEAWMKAEGFLPAP